MGAILPLSLLMLDPATVIAPQPQPCQTATSSEIVVCHQARSPDQYRLKPLPQADPDQGPRKAEWRLSDSIRAGAEVSQKAMQAGVVSDRVMATARIRF